jgi:hypothetical protein
MMIGLTFGLIISGMQIKRQLAKRAQRLENVKDPPNSSSKRPAKESATAKDKKDN